ncbi:TadE/TadG family type IV pilus assembly protein [Streptomyces sp. NPDC014733]|uniref:TadE/TadG family type IV pilus assembly protein n=1 Tax=Streptomyces sp. NPDC014733 TaxID=3364885 RepID=UPI0036F9A3DB
MNRTTGRGARPAGPARRAADAVRPTGPGASDAARAPGARRSAGGRRFRGPARDRGQASLEFLGFLPLLLIVGLAVVQLGIAAFAVQQAGTGARAAARTASLDPPDRQRDPAAAGRAAMTGWVAERARIGVGGAGDAVRATTTVTLPSVIPGITLGTVTRSATMPRPAAAHAPGAAPEGVLAP